MVYQLTFSKSQLFKIIQRGGSVVNFLDLLNPYKSPIFNPQKKKIKKIINKADELSKKVVINDIIKTATDSKNVISALKNALDKVLGTGITLTHNEIKNIIKVIKFLEKRTILLKGTARKITSQERDFC